MTRKTKESLNHTYEIERAKWDAVAQEKSRNLKPVKEGDNFQKYADRASTMVGINDFLGDLNGKKVLEYGCGLGELSVLLANSGAYVTSFDLSPTSTQIANERAILNGVDDRMQLSVAAGERIPFKNESFDIVFGKAILHHLDVRQGWHEIYRVLKTGGKAAFVEPMGMNPVLKFVREYVPYPHKNPRGADRPLNYDEIHAWGQCYSDFHYQEIHLLTMLERGLGFNSRLETLRKMDDFLLANFPFLRRHCRYVGMFMVK